MVAAGMTAVVLGRGRSSRKEQGCCRQGRRLETSTPKHGFTSSFSGSCWASVSPDALVSSSHKFYADPPASCAERVRLLGNRLWDWVWGIVAFCKPVYLCTESQR